MFAGREDSPSIVSLIIGRGPDQMPVIKFDYNGTVSPAEGIPLGLAHVSDGLNLAPDQLIPGDPQPFRLGVK